MCSCVAEAAAPPTALESAEAAVRQMQASDLRGAAVTTRQALDANPADTLLHNLAATLLMMTGDTAGAVSEWTTVLRDMPGDSFALYGLGLVSLAKGDRTKALDLLQVAERNGDRACCLLAQRYLESLNGARGGGTGLTLPGPLEASAQGLSGVSAARSGDHRRALEDISAALAALPGDPYAEPAGLIMTFEREAPVRTGLPPLPTGNGLARQRGKQNEKAFSGTITLKPDGVDAYTGFVMYKVDGSVSSILNSPPYQLVWDTSKVPNGLHRIEILIFDKNGQEATRAQKELRTANADAPSRTPSGEGARQEQVRGTLWQSLALHPGRHALAFQAAESARSIGDMKAASQYLELAAALAPGYGNIREKWLAAMGGTASPALWRGSNLDNVVALTFDDGPKPGVTEMLLNVLKQERVPATFFVIGRHTTANPGLARMIADAGMQIENHSYTHPNLTLLEPEDVERELIRTMASVRAATGKQMKYFRPPGGNLNSEVSRLAAQWGLTPCMWTVDGDTLENGPGDVLVEYVLKHSQPGAIILLHNGRLTTIEALPRIIAGLRQRGFGFVTIDQLAQRKAAAAASSVAAGSK